MLRIAILTLCLSLSPAFAAEITVPAGKEVSMPGTDLTIRLTGVDDARCPSDVDCYWEGLIRLKLTLTDASGQMADIVLCNLCDDATHEAVAMGQHIAFARLEPGRDVLDRLDRPVFVSDYTAILTVQPD